MTAEALTGERLEVLALRIDVIAYHLAFTRDAVVRGASDETIDGMLLAARRLIDAARRDSGLLALDTEARLLAEMDALADTEDDDADDDGASP